MSTSLARTAEGWWLVTPAGLVPLGLPAVTTAQLIADQPAVDRVVAAARATAAAEPQRATAPGSVDLLSPVTAPARIVAQAVNYRSHARESGLDADTVPPIFFRKASHSLTSATGEIIRPPRVGFLDYEVELGLVIGADLQGQAAVLTAGQPGADLVSLCRRQRLLFVRVIGGLAPGVSGLAGIPGHAPGQGQRTDCDYAEVSPAGGCGTAALEALLRYPEMAVLVRPDRVIAAVATAPMLPRPPWSIPEDGDIGPSRDSRDSRSRT